MSTSDEYFSSFREEGPIYTDRKWYVIRVIFTKHTEHKHQPQWGAMKIFLKKNKKRKGEAIFLMKSSECHQNVVKFYHHMVLNNGQYAIFMELCKTNLAEIIYSNSHCMNYWKNGEFISICATITKTLKTLHKAKFMHRDIKPLNILISNNNEIRICDFEHCKEFKMNQANTLLGTKKYMSPFLLKWLKKAVVITKVLILKKKMFDRL